MPVVNSSFYPQQRHIAAYEAVKGSPPPAPAAIPSVTASPSSKVTISAEAHALSSAAKANDPVVADGKKQWHSNNARWEAKIENLHAITRQNNIARSEKNSAEHAASMVENKQIQEAEVKKQVAERTQLPPPIPAQLPPPPPPPPHEAPSVSVHA